MTVHVVHRPPTPCVRSGPGTYWRVSGGSAPWWEFQGSPRRGQIAKRLPGGGFRNSRCTLGVGSELFEGLVTDRVHTQTRKFAHAAAHRFSVSAAAC